MLEQHRRAGSNVVLDSAGWLATFAAGGGTLFIAPLVYDWTIPMIRAFSRATYGPDWVDPIGFVWAVISTLIVFSALRMSLGLAIMFGAIAIVSRVFV